jgi:4-amino-4-deoxy-L-arabinose transferase-like glycosyltransferase
MYASVGLGVLTMGPVNLIMPGMVVFFYLIVMKDIRHIKELRLVWGILIFLIITCPWYVLVSLKEGYGFDLLIRTNISRYFDTWTHAQPFYYYLKDFPWAFAPWSLFLPGALMLAFSKRTQEDRPAIKLIIVWMISLFLFFSFSQAKRPQYILAIYPAFALLVGYLGDKAVNCWQDKYYQKQIIIPSLIFIGVLALATVALPVFTALYFKTWFMSALGVSIIAGFFAVLQWLAYHGRQVRRLLFMPAVFMLIFTLYSVHVLIPKAEYYKSPRAFCEEIVTHLDRGGQWAMYRFYRAAYVYYTDSFCTVLKNESDLKTYLDQPKLSLVVMKEKHYKGLADSLKKKTYLIAKQQIGHRPMVLLANQKPS